MSAGAELCPHCSYPTRLLEGTDGMGRAFLDCLCGYRENVGRKADPSPSVRAVHIDANGIKRTKYLQPKATKAQRRTT